MQILNVAPQSSNAPIASASPVTSNGHTVRTCVVAISLDYYQPDPASGYALKKRKHLSRTGTLWAGLTAYSPGDTPLAFGFGENCSGAEREAIVARFLEIAGERGLSNCEVCTTRIRELATLNRSSLAARGEIPGLPEGRFLGPARHKWQAGCVPKAPKLSVRN